MKVTNRYEIYTVSRLNAEVRMAVEGSFPSMKVEGEISNLACPTSGHIYFSLKDAGAQVRCALFRSKRRMMRCEPKNGDKVLIRAKVTLYEPRGDYQLVAESMETAGEGALRQAYEELKNQLQTEGLFNPELKKTLPSYPRCIGVITSASGAALQDVLSVLKRRYPIAQIRVYPTLVQGNTAPKDIIKALKQANQQAQCDILLLTRGGGSLEDLMAFNDEDLAREIFASRLPIVSAIGHEIDFTIADFVADLRAPTPSVAAELITPDNQDLIRKFQQIGESLHISFQHIFHKKRFQIDVIDTKLQHLSPLNQCIQNAQRLDYLWIRLLNTQQQIMKHKNIELQPPINFFYAKNISADIHTHHLKLNALQQRLQLSLQHILKQGKQQLSHIARELHAYSPLATLDRGYAITYSTEHKVISKIEQVDVNQQINIQLAQGNLTCTILKKSALSMTP